MNAGRFLFAALWLMATSSTALGACKLTAIAEWPLRANAYRPVIDGAINGQKIGIIVDTGAANSMIARSAVKRLGLNTYYTDSPYAYGIGGETRVEAALVEELDIAGAVRRNWRAQIAGEREFGGDVALLLGNEFLQQLDVEFDLAKKIVRLYEARDCRGVRLAYWDPQALEVPLEGASEIRFTVSINGKPVSAQLDSGASSTLLSLEGALRLGVTPQTAGVTPSGCVYGVGKRAYDSWLAPLESFAIGGEVIRNPRIRFADIWGHNVEEKVGSNVRRRLEDLPELLIGSSFLHSHRVLVANSQRKLYFSYTGGAVFPPVAGKPCSETPK